MKNRKHKTLKKRVDGGTNTMENITSIKAARGPEATFEDSPDAAPSMSGGQRASSGLFSPKNGEY